MHSNCLVTCYSSTVFTISFRPLTEVLFGEEEDVPSGVSGGMNTT